MAALKPHVQPTVLVCNEVGHLSYGSDDANVLYHVVDARSVQRRSMLVCCILGYACLICRFGSRGRPELFGARGGERSEPERAPNRDGGRTVTGLAVRGR